MTDEENRNYEVCSQHRRILIEILGMLDTERRSHQDWDQSKGVVLEIDPSGDDYELTVDGPGGICHVIIVAVSGNTINVKWRPWESMDADRPFYSVAIADPNSFDKTIKAVLALAEESLKTKPLVDTAFALSDLSACMMRDARKMIGTHKEVT